MAYEYILGLRRTKLISKNRLMMLIRVIFQPLILWMIANRLDGGNSDLVPAYLFGVLDKKTILRGQWCGLHHLKVLTQMIYFF